MSSPPRRIAFRFEMGGAIGWGHLARCSALASELRQRGWECTAWTDGRLATAPDELGAPFSATLTAGERWAEQLPAEVAMSHWIVVDAYGTSDDHLRALRTAGTGAQLLVIDDDAQRDLDVAQIVVNCRLGLETAPYRCERPLLGERYAMLRAGLSRPATVAAFWATEQLPVLVMLGGTDARGLTASVLAALAEVEAHRLVPIVVRSHALPEAGAVTRALQRFSASRWIERIDASTLAGWAGVCHCAVSACGGTLYELAYLGLPFVGIVVAENQRALAEEVAARWRLPVVDGPGNECAAVSAGVRRLLAAPRPVPRGPLGGIDGLGAARVADVIEEWVQ